MRLFPHGNYVILFSTVNGSVLIERVLHGARDLPMAVKAPNLDTIAAMQETRAMGRARFKSAQDYLMTLTKSPNQKHVNLPSASDRSKAFFKD